MTREVTPDDGHAVFVLYQCYRERAGSFDEFKDTAKGFELGYMVVDGEVVGVASRMCGWLHIGVIESWRGRWATRSFIRKIIQWAAESGPVKTGIMFGNESGRRLVEGVGFKKVGASANGKGTIYEIPTHS